MSGNISASFVLNTNNSNEAFRGQWSGMAIFQIIFSALAFITNGFVFVLFFRHSRLRTPFTVYLINLLIANLVILLVTPLTVLELMRTDWFAKSRWCLVLLYSDLISSGILLHSHLLITVNRIWAIVCPISYRNTHTKRTAVAICVGIWLYVHAVILPFYVLEQTLYGEGFDSDGWCVVNVSQQVLYTQVMVVVVFLAPYVAMLAAYPFLWHLRWSRKRTLPHKQEFIPLEGTAPSKPLVDQQVSSVQKTPSDRSTAFTVLTVHTISMLVCWSISQVYSAVLSFTGVEIGWLGQWGATMYLLQIVLDPVLFALVLPDLRAAIARTIKSGHTRSFL